MKKKSRNKHLLKKRKKKLAMLEGKTVTRLRSLKIGDLFYKGGIGYTVADNEIVGGFVACLNNATGEQEWIEADTAV